MDKNYLAMPDKAFNDMAGLQTGVNRMNMVRRSPEDIAASAGEHGAFTRDAVNRNLAMAPILSYVTAPYAAAKLAKEYMPFAKEVLNYTGLVNEDATPPSFAQMFASYGGIASGVGDRFAQAKQGVLDWLAPQQPAGKK